MEQRATNGQSELKEPREGAVFGHRYLLRKKLRSGGMGSVWLATHTELNRPCAIKFILCHDEASLPKLRSRFRKEAQAIAILHGHPNVVQILDFGTDDDVPYIAMELLSGETLRDRLRREMRLSIPATRKILRDVGSGVGRAHKLRIVHRDLKPANIFLARNDDDDETAKILDFGIAKILSESISSATSKVLGTISYMSPEQMRNDPSSIDERTDLWALGIIVFECLTGESPHEANNNVGILSSVLLGEGPQWNISSRTPNIPQALDKFFRRAFCHDKRERFQSAAEMLRAFDESVKPEAEVSSSARTLPLVHRLAAVQQAGGLDAPADVETTLPMSDPAVPETRWDGTPNLSPWTPQMSAVTTLRLNSPEPLPDAQGDQAIPDDGLALETVPAAEQPLRRPALPFNILTFAASAKSSIVSFRAHWGDPGARARAVALGLLLLAVLTGVIALLFVALGVAPDNPRNAVERAVAAPPAQDDPATIATLPSSIPGAAAGPSSIPAEPSPSPSATPSSLEPEQPAPEPDVSSAPVSGSALTPAVPRPPTIAPPLSPRRPPPGPSKPVAPKAPTSKQPTPLQLPYYGD